ncbi:MAG: hypothetical protein IKR17_02805 [Bacteroidales bacterium]|nr:hypothetical protein [Bacteroidales bacterium]
MPRLTDPFEKQHIANLAKYAKLIDAIYNEATREAGAIAATVSNFNADKIFSFADYPATRQRVEKLIAALADDTQVAIVNGIDSEWTLANNKNNELARRVFGDNVGKLTQQQYRRYFTDNEAAHQAFVKRKEKGLSLSDRVWHYSDMFKDDMELSIDLGLRGGLSASEISRDLRQYLQHPDMLFRRVRDEHGNLVLSQRAKDFHPGQGVYRSSYMNARRLAVTETNIAYRTSDFERVQNFDFVVGIEICLSNNHNCKGFPAGAFSDICDELAGRYPKTFKFTGWHPHCRCHVKTILKTPEELMAENRIILDGGEPSESSVNSVKEVPKAFGGWIKENVKRIEASPTPPYYLRDNKDWVEIAKIQEGALTIQYESLREQRQIIRAEVDNHNIKLDEYEVDVQLTNKNIKEWLNQPHSQITEKNEALKYIDQILNSAKYVGNGEDEHNNSIKMHLFETKIGGIKSWIIVRQMMNGEYKLHSISDNATILTHIKENRFPTAPSGTAIPRTRRKPIR